LPAFRAGGPIQSIANLVRNYHEDIEYFIFCGDVDLNGGVLENITTGEWIDYNDHTKVWYATPEKLSDSLVKQVEEVHPDILYIIGLYSWHFNMVPLVFCKAPKKILSARGMLHPGALSQKKWKKIIYLQLFKLLEYQHKIIFHATDSEEERFIRNHFGKPAVINVAGNFPNDIGALSIAKKIPGKLNLLSIALISPMKNIMMVLESLQHIGTVVQYDIYGPVKDHTYWEQCGAKIKLLPTNIKVTIHKEIEPLQVKEVLLNAHVFILPSKSENFGHSIYEALSSGRPVITSNYTPWSGLQESFAGMNVSIEDNTGLTKAINFFAAMDEITLLQWYKGAIDYSGKAIDVEKIRQQYREMFVPSPSTLGERQG
jgi:glycosyltransferase involved in cell wall biosynthesis